MGNGFTTGDGFTTDPKDSNKAPDIVQETLGQASLRMAREDLA
jgi:hypothetical protein